MTLAELSIKRPVLAWMVMAALIIFGAISVSRLGVSMMPDYDSPVLNINTQWPGAAPDIMEAEIVDRIEQAVISVQGIKEISSSVNQGSANVTIEFELERDIDAALQEVQSSISRIRFPTEVDPPTIRKDNPDDNPIMWLGVWSDRPLRDLIVYADLHLRDQFQVVPGVGEVLLGGFAERNLRVWIDNDKLRQYELTVIDVQDALAAEHIETAAGIIENNQQEFNVRTMGEGMTAGQVENILITKRGGRPIYNTSIRMKDVARIEDGLNDIRRYTRVTGNPGIGLGIKKQRGANAVEVAKLVRKKVGEVSKTLPEDIKININFDSTRFIEESVHETEFTLVLSALATALVCWLFLGSWSSTFNILLSIPTSIVGTFTVLYFMGFTLNFFTLLGLALAVGIVVDDAIMVLENIFRHQSMGKDRVTAARDGAVEITFAAMATSVAVMAIFLPVAFMEGVIGRFFFQFGVTISAAVALSLLEAVTLTPMRCSQFMQKPDQESWYTRRVEGTFNKLADFYKNVLTLCLNWRWTVVGGSILLFLISLGIGGLIKKEMAPPQDQSLFMIRFETPVGSSLEFTRDRVLQAEKLISSRPEIFRYFTAVGSFRSGEVNEGLMFITMVPKPERNISQQKFMDWARGELKKVPDLKSFLVDLSTSGMGSSNRSYPVEFNIRGPDWETLRSKTEEFLKKLEATGLVVDVNTDYKLGMPEVRIWPDRERAGRSGVSMEDLGRTINAAIGGVREGKFTQDGRRYDVRLRLEPGQRLKPEDLDALEIRTTYGELVDLKEVTKIEVVQTLQTITRKNRERSISVTANVAPGKSQGEALAAVERLSREILPEGYQTYVGGAAQNFAEAGESLMFALILGIVVSYMVLASQFNSFVHPFTVLLALPFSISGALVALLLTQQTLNLFSGIGIILLMGIVKKNSILLVDFANRKRYLEGMPLTEAILAAGPIRLRPILMTSLATIAAAIPPALALGPGAESRIPMSIAIIGGMIVSTVFTLVVVPCAYSLLARLEHGKTAVSPG